MPPRHQTLPPAQTESAREAMQAFYCQLCSKGYSRMNDYEAHLSSYDHAHRQRLKDMKAMVKGEPSRSRKSDTKDEGLISIKLGELASSGGGSGFKKGGFKKAGFAPISRSSAPKKADDATDTLSSGVPKPSSLSLNQAELESDTEEEGYEVYDPRYPTD